MPHLNFLDCDFYHEDYNSNSDEDEDVEVANKARMEAFGRFVDMVLQHRDASAYLQSLRICWDFFVDMRRVYRWVEYAMEHHVREADLSVSDYYDGMELPSALFTSPWLQEPSCGFRPREFKEEHWKITAPTSLMHCLTTVSIIRFKGTMNDHEFLKFLVANARALRNVHLAPVMTRFLYNHL